MAPTKPSPKTSSQSKPVSSASRVSKDKNAKRPPPQEVKSKARSEPSQLKKKQKREYTEDELDLPKLNAITPVGVVKPKGKKKGKTFVDDRVGFALLCFAILYLQVVMVANCWLGGHDDDSSHGERGKGRSD